LFQSNSEKTLQESQPSSKHLPFGEAYDEEKKGIFSGDEGDDKDQDEHDEANLLSGGRNKKVGFGGTGIKFNHPETEEDDVKGKFESGGDRPFSAFKPP
jgi:hypothetical protein